MTQNADQRQALAADPLASVWVNASAGTGKTKVLTDRVLRLLLIGTAPERILCITFTKAAAAEMARRIQDRLSAWAAIPETDLADNLEKLTGAAPDLALIKRARQLFGRVVDAPGGLKIQTIHAFCTSVLRRFPLEAGISPQFDVLDDARSDALLTHIRDQLIVQTTDADLARSVRHLTTLLVAEQFQKLMARLNSERRTLAALLKHQGGLSGAIRRIEDHTKATEQDDPATLIADFCRDENCHAVELRAMISVFEKAKTARAKKILLAITPFLASPAASRPDYFAVFNSVFFNKDGSIPENIVTNDCAPARDLMLSILAKLQKLKQRQKEILITRHSIAVLRLGAAMLTRYDMEKARRGLLDYEDQVLKTRDLLLGPLAAEWVMYKLDGGLDHLLVDEAQDTNPAQWQIIQALTEDFFSGDAARTQTRTLFVVGDDKQSIYSFQGADPREFHRMRDYFKQRVEAIGQPWNEISLDTSFRSTAVVLALVDAVFTDGNPAANGVLRPGRLATEHHAYRAGMAGRVECWPLVQPEPKPEGESWVIGEPDTATKDPAAQLADNIAKYLAGLIGHDLLPARGRAVQPGDCLILVRQRNKLVEHLIRALKKYQVPVAGVDRMRVIGQLPVQDLLALAQFVLLPDDDLNFAGLLKSPLVGLDDLALIDLTARRSSGANLWQRFSQMAPDRNGWLAIRDWLDDWLRQADFMPPYEFFAQLLHRPCPAHPQSGRAALIQRLGRDILDPIDEFLQLAIDFQAKNIPSLEQFLHAMAADRHEIKREMDVGAGVVRIMTVHAAKGLQAPIVILPDTVLARPLKVDNLLWPDDLAEPFLWAPRKEDDIDLRTARREIAAAAATAEYHRLLYVALTRAEDRLILAGYGGKEKDVTSWYAHLQQALQGDNHRDGEQTVAARPDVQHRDLILPEKLPETETWLYQPPPAIVAGPGRLVPSRHMAEPVIFSPFADAALGDPFRRGILIHRLLQNLPDIAAERRPDAAYRWLEKSASDWPQSVRGAMVAETIAILDHPIFAPVFGPQSRAEVPLTGVVAGQIIDAQLDRLVILPDRVLVVDYKTNRPPPRDIADVPIIYRRQMACYVAALSRLYPQRRIEAALLWTAIPLLMPIPIDDDLSKAM